MEPDSIRILFVALLISVTAVCVTIVHDIMRDLDAAKKTTRLLVEMMPHNAYARYLGEEVMAKIYEQSEWSRCVVVAISWHGSVCVRPADDLATKGRWIHHAFARGRIKLIGEQHE